MPMKARYTVIDGELVAEKRNGVRSLYVPDLLGTTRALLDNTQTQTDTFVAWPYGDTEHLTGRNPTPFVFVGAQGYYDDNAGKTYVRARELEPPKAKWLTEEPDRFDADDWNLYLYAGANPVTYTDPSGLTPCMPGGPPTGGQPGNSGTRRPVPKILQTCFFPNFFNPEGGLVNMEKRIGKMCATYMAHGPSATLHCCHKCAIDQCTKVCKLTHGNSSVGIKACIHRCKDAGYKTCASQGYGPPLAGDPS
jgi:RHS repeat-associated protein